MRNFRNLEIWKEGISIIKQIYKLVAILPDNEKYGLRSQMCRAAVSIPCNIAEGSSRGSEIDFKRFLEMAEGSAFELETQLIVLTEIEMCSQEQVNPVMQRVVIIEEKINALINKIKRSIEGQ